MYKTAGIICALALVQSISAQCIGAYTGYAADVLSAPYGGYIGAPFAESAWATPYGIGELEGWGYGAGLCPAALAASNGAGLAVISSSSIAPTGVSVLSENAYEGPLAITGAIPFLGAVALEGALPTAGAGAVTYACGNGDVAILAEDINNAGFNAYGAAYGFDGLAGPAFAYDGLNGPYGYNSLLRPFAYDGVVGPACGTYGYNGLYY
ncbi:unnamed protein product [Euphydryas editha]|uniref:Uncharacterized protein n=1 Tax=Euphydryas editha TaxID=104508 RepID=A0AAU9T8U7_EUPED|nr:unnamed protein product [Euphydryas editha]